MVNERHNGKHVSNWLRAVLFATGLILTTVPVVSHAQDGDTDGDLPVQGPPVTVDSAGPRRMTEPQATPPVDTAQAYLWKSNLLDSPTGKLLRSIAIPGWGQWSNGKKWKAGAVFAVESYFFARALIWRGRTFDRQHLWEASCVDGNCDATLFNDYSSARDRRNYFYWLTGFTVFISMFDAYADAYLISLERTRDKGDEFWGGHAFLFPEDEYRLVATLKF